MKKRDLCFQSKAKISFYVSWYKTCRWCRFTGSRDIAIWIQSLSWPCVKSTALKGPDQLWEPVCVSLAVSTSPLALCVYQLKHSQHPCVPAGVIFQRILETDMDFLPQHATSSPSPMSPSVSTKQLLWMIPLCVIQYLSCTTLSNVGCQFLRENWKSWSLAIKENKPFC